MCVFAFQFLSVYRLAIYAVVVLVPFCCCLPCLLLSRCLLYDAVLIFNIACSSEIFTLLIDLCLLGKYDLPHPPVCLCFYERKLYAIAVYEYRLLYLQFSRLLSYYLMVLLCKVRWAYHCMYCNEVR